MPDFVRCFKYVAKYKSDFLSKNKVWGIIIINFDKLIDCTLWVENLIDY